MFINSNRNQAVHLEAKKYYCRKGLVSLSVIGVIISQSMVKALQYNMRLDGKRGLFLSGIL